MALYTSADTYPDSDRPRQRQSIAYSKDKGRTWTTYDKNPILSDENFTDFRDPKVFWHEESEKWVMVLVAGKSARLYTSNNLKSWEFASEFSEDQGAYLGVWECADLFELPVQGSLDEKKWVLIVSLGDDHGGKEGSRTQYFIGDFDGKTFTNDHSPETILWLDHGRDNYAGVSWSDIPKEDGRRIYIGWMSNWIYANLVPTKEWRSAMTLPRVLSLKKKEEGIRLIQTPVKELEILRADEVSVSEQVFTAGEHEISGLEGKTFELIAEFELGDAKEFGFNVLRGAKEKTIIGYDVENKNVYVNREKSGDLSFHEHFSGIHEARLEPNMNKIKLHIFVDWSSVEVFGNDGEIAITDLVFPEEDGVNITLFVKDGCVTLKSLQFYPLNSIWKK